jgi:hypothetical protein
VRRLALLLAAASLLGGSAVAVAKQPALPEKTVRVGYGQADATWHVGAAAGQYSDPNTGLLEGLASYLEEGDVEGAAEHLQEAQLDPHVHSRAKAPSYGVHSRLTARAIVVEGLDGERVVLLKTDNYLAQDLLLRRVGQLLDDGESGIGYEDLLHHATHNHSSPYYTTTSPGVFIFQDVVDHRMLEHQARAVRDAIEAAAADLRPARMSATTVEHSLFKANVVGEAVADDGSPAGYPREYGDTGVVVMRFEALEPRGKKGKLAPGEPIATWVNFGQHPESLDGYGLTTADFLGPLERFVERDTGAPLVFSQGDVGSAEGPYDRADTNTTPTPDGTVRAYAHAGYAQMERGARLLADAVVAGYQRAGTDAAQVPWSSAFPVALRTEWVPGPLSHPYPSVGNCRTEPTVQGDPGIGVAPDCERAGLPRAAESLSIHGLPVPAHYGAPGFPAVEENTRLKLQVLRLGEVLLASCACEAQVDLVLNLESRANRAQGDMHLGYLWECTPAGGAWRCPQRDRVLTVTDAAYQRMRAQVLNDARGWDDPSYVAQAEAEPADPADIKGNFTHEELPPSLGYALPVGVGHAGDYNGYTVSYREYMSRESYRKALNSYGPHTADYMVTRLVRMAGELKGGPAFALDPADAVRAAADEARQVAVAESVGRASAAAYDAWLAGLPADVGPVAPVAQPAAVVERFGAATFSWRGGSNAVDNPVARVERRVDGRWEPFADMTGEVQTRVDFPRGVQGVADTWTGAQEWVWTASFEAYSAFPARLGTTPPGTYRFVVEGASRATGETAPYELTSQPFEVRVWDGVSLGSASVADGVASFTATARYPRTYASSFRTIADDGGTRFCRTCSFRPWATSGRVVSVTVTVTGPEGASRDVTAVQVGERWTVPLAAGERAVVRAGAALDEFGNANGSPLVLA